MENREIQFEGNREIEPRPQLIIDFIRHGEAEYGEELLKQLEATGQNSETFKQLPKISPDIFDAKTALEGRITESGKAELEESIRSLSAKIDRDNEMVAVLYGPRTRHKESAEIIIEELEKLGIPVFKSKEHSGLIDFKDSWISLVEYAIQHQGKSSVDLEQSWWEMYQNPTTREEMEKKGYEHLEHVQLRMEFMSELLRRFARRFTVEKTLRIIAVTSDVNIEQHQQKHIPMEDRDQILVKNAEIFESKIWNDENGNLLKESSESI